jgi:hypothetical protein
VLRDLSLWEKRDSRIMTLSGGMKRRVLIAKGQDDGDALLAQAAHQPPHVLAQFHVDAGGRLVEESGCCATSRCGRSATAGS